MAGFLSHLPPLTPSVFYLVRLSVFSIPSGSHPTPSLPPYLAPALPPPPPFPPPPQIEEVVCVETEAGWNAARCTGESWNFSRRALNVPLEQQFLWWEIMRRAAGKGSGGEEGVGVGWFYQGDEGVCVSVVWGRLRSLLSLWLWHFSSGRLGTGWVTSWGFQLQSSRIPLPRVSVLHPSAPSVACRSGGSSRKRRVDVHIVVFKTQTHSATYS